MGAPVQIEQEEPPPGPKLTRTMSSRKLQALDFIKRYFARWGHSPTLGELAAHLDVSTKRAYDLVHQLSDERQLEITAGKARGIRLIDRGEELGEADILLRLSALGYTIGRGSSVIMPPEHLGGAAAIASALGGLTEKGLPRLDFTPDKPPPDGGVGTEAGGKTEEEPDGARPSANARRSRGGQQSEMGSPSS